MEGPEVAALQQAGHLVPQALQIGAGGSCPCAWYGWGQAGISCTLESVLGWVLPYEAAVRLLVCAGMGDCPMLQGHQHKPMVRCMAWPCRYLWFRFHQSGGAGGAYQVQFTPC